jgi:hypothetical protein
MSIRPDLAGLRVLAGLLALTVLPACGPIEVPVNLNLDPSGPNELVLEDPFGNVETSQLVGGVAATLILDTDKLLTWRGVFATLRVDDIRIAGSEFAIVGIPTGIICLAPDPDLASGGFAYLRPLFKKEADIQLTLNSLAFVTRPELAPLAPPLPFGATIETQVPLSLADLAALAAGEGGSLVITETIMDTLPPDIFLVGGSDITVTVTMTNADAQAEDPLLDHCDDFFAMP